MYPMTSGLPIGSAKPVVRITVRRAKTDAAYSRSTTGLAPAPRGAASNRYPATETMLISARDSNVAPPDRRHQTEPISAKLATNTM
jgi:hypothetical protein